MAERRASGGWLDCAASRLMRCEEMLAATREPAHAVAAVMGAALVELGRALAALPALDRGAALMCEAAVHLSLSALDHMFRGDRDEARECAGAAVRALHSVLLEHRRG